MLDSSLYGAVLIELEAGISAGKCAALAPPARRRARRPGRTKLDLFDEANGALLILEKRRELFPKNANDRALRTVEEA